MGSASVRSGEPPLVRISGVTHRFGRTTALRDLSAEIPPGIMVGLVGPDGVGKSTLLSLVTGVRALRQGRIEVLGGDISSAAHRRRICPRIAYMPQGLGKNLYFTLSVEENLLYFARLFGHSPAECRRRIDMLTTATGLHPFLDRAAGKLSGGMKQKLGLCCALIHDPDLLVLDEPTTGVDPLARLQFWKLIDRVRAARPRMGVLVATAYMDEARRFDRLIAMDDGRILAVGTPDELMKRTGCDSLDAAFIRLLPEEKRGSHREPVPTPLPDFGESGYVIEAKGLTKRFGSFTAVDHVSFRIRKGEIFGFLGSNGCGKTTTMRMLTGLLPATEGSALLFGAPLRAGDVAARRNLGYMTQSFSLYSELTVRRNLVLYARLFQLPEKEIPRRVDEMLRRFQLENVADAYPGGLPLGIRQRMSLAAAVIHRPAILILDEPTSGVDPVARDGFWELLLELSRRDGVTIFITTHFMNEAMRCDRISMMHAGRSLACDTPAALIAARGAASLEEAFIGFLREADPEGNGEGESAGSGGRSSAPAFAAAKSGDPGSSGAPLSEGGEPLPERRPMRGRFSFLRCRSCCRREMLELIRDPIRLTLALFGALILMLVIGFGINMDVEELSYAVLDLDRSMISRNYALSIAGSRYFRTCPPVKDHFELDRRMRNGELSMVLEFPPGFGRDLEKGETPQLSVWIDGSMPSRAQTIRGYVQGIHTSWLAELRRLTGGNAGTATGDASIEVRYRYNPEVQSLPAMVPAVMPILLLMIPAILAALAVVREKELGSIINLYATPLTKAEFLLGKQLPYVLFAFASALLLLAETRFIFDVPVKGSLPTLLLALLLYCFCTTGLGLVASSVTRSQIAVMFMTMVGTMIPAVQFCGLTNPVTTLNGAGRLIGSLYPATYMLAVSRGIFNKSLGFGDLWRDIAVLAVSAAVIVSLGILLQKKQEK